MPDAGDVYFKRTRELGALLFEDPPKPRRVIAGLMELVGELGAIVEATDGVLAPDAPAPKQPDGPVHELVIKGASNAPGQPGQPAPKNLQACAAGSHDWGPFDPNVGGHVCLQCETVYTRRA